MNNRGFTLVELLATIVILGLVLGIASYGVIGAINNSKKSSERVFVSKVSDLIQGHLAMNGSSLTKEIDEVAGEFYKCRDVDSEDINCSNSYKVRLFKLEPFHLSDATKSIEDDKFINPATKERCSKEALVYVFRDEEYVYYYYVKLSDAGCGISDDINTLPSSWVLPDDLKTELKLRKDEEDNSD